MSILWMYSNGIVQEASRRTQQDTLGDGTEVVTKPLFAFGNFGTAKKAEPKEESKTTGVSVKAGLGGLFGSQKTSKRGVWILASTAEQETAFGMHGRYSVLENNRNYAMLCPCGVL